MIASTPQPRLLLLIVSDILRIKLRNAKMASYIINFKESGENPLAETKIYMRIIMARAHADTMVISYAYLLFYSAASRPKHSFAVKQKKLLSNC